MNDINQQQDILEDAGPGMELEDASVGQRLANYIIDFLVFYALIFAVAFVAAALVPGAAEFFASLEDTPSIMDRIYTLISYGLYMSFVEAIFKGRSLGKLITRTAAISEEGERLTFKKAFSRGLVRMVPFDQLSALGGRPWHDRWTGTRVIKLRN